MSANKNYSLELRIAIEAVKNGAKVALKYFHRDLDVELKEDDTPVTIADRESEKAIKKHILKAFSNAKFVGEETGGDIDSDEFWTIDPIDGTKNFMRGIELWAILISLYRNGEAVIGVSYMPAIDELLYAERGKGAFINSKKVHVSGVSDIKNAFLSHGETKSSYDPYMMFLLSKHFMTSRGIGDAWSYHLVATGKIDVMLEENTHIWDIAPFTVIIPEAGGRFTNLEGREWGIHDTTALATNGLLHDEVIGILNQEK